MPVILVFIYASECIKYPMEELPSKESHFGDVIMKEIFKISILIMI